MATIEKDVEARLVRLVRAHGGLCLKWVCPGWAGVPDRMVLLPGGKIIFCEVKRPDGGRVAPLQGWWRNKLRTLGFTHYYIATSKDLEALALEITTEVTDGN